MENKTTKTTPKGDPASPDTDASHPALDGGPREEPGADQNRIDFNDPSLTGRESVEHNLKTVEKKAD